MGQISISQKCVLPQKVLLAGEGQENTYVRHLTFNLIKFCGVKDYFATIN